MHFVVRVCGLFMDVTSWSNVGVLDSLVSIVAVDAVILNPPVMVS